MSPPIKRTEETTYFSLYKMASSFPTGLQWNNCTCYFNVYLQIVDASPLYRRAIYKISSLIENECAHAIRDVLQEMNKRRDSFQKQEEFLSALKTFVENEQKILFRVKTKDLLHPPSDSTKWNEYEEKLFKARRDSSILNFPIALFLNRPEILEKLKAFQNSYILKDFLEQIHIRINNVLAPDLNSSNDRYRVTGKQGLHDEITTLDKEGISYKGGFYERIKGLIEENILNDLKKEIANVAGFTSKDRLQQLKEAYDELSQACSLHDLEGYSIFWHPLSHLTLNICRGDMFWHIDDNAFNRMLAGLQSKTFKDFFKEWETARPIRKLRRVNEETIDLHNGKAYFTRL